MVILTAPCLVLAAVILSLSQPAEPAPKFLLVETEDDPKDANEAEKGLTEKDIDEYIDEVKDDDDKIEALIKELDPRSKIKDEAEKDNKGASQGEDYDNVRPLRFG